LFVSVFNFISASKIEASFLGKQQQINSLEQSILASEYSYNSVSSNDYVENWAEQNNYVNKQDGVNSFTINIDGIYEEQFVEEVPSNWFNDVCEFFSKLFAA
jgi:hypothetical protein